MLVISRLSPDDGVLKKEFDSSLLASLLAEQNTSTVLDG